MDTITFSHSSTSAITLQGKLNGANQGDSFTVNATGKSNYEFAKWVYKSGKINDNIELKGEKNKSNNYTIFAYFDKVAESKKLSELQKLIVDAEPGSTIKLDCNYVRLNKEDKGIVINKKITLDLDGYSIDGNYVADNDKYEKEANRVNSVLRIVKDGELIIKNGVITGGYNSYMDYGPGPGGEKLTGRYCAYAGGIIVNGGKANIDNITVFGNIGVWGGGISVTTEDLSYSMDTNKIESHCKINNSKIIFNYGYSANGEAGGLYVENDSTIIKGSTLEVKNTIITQNIGAQRGGGVVCEVDGYYSMSGGEITLNNAEQNSIDVTGGGGGLCIRYGGEVTLNKVNIGGPNKGNSVTYGSGGGIYVYHSYNPADYVLKNKVTLINCNISYNNSSDGAGIATLIDKRNKIAGPFSNEVIIKGGIISNNVAETFGGGIGSNITSYNKYSTENANCNITIEDTKIINNIAKAAGGILMNTGADGYGEYAKNTHNVSMKNCKISGNISTGSTYGGSAIFISSMENNESNMILSNTIVSNNKCLTNSFIHFGSSGIAKLVIGGSTNFINNTRGHFNSNDVNNEWVVDEECNLEIGRNIAVDKNDPLSPDVKIMIDVPVDEKGVPKSYMILSCDGGASADNFVSSNSEFRTVTKVDGIYIELNLNLVLINDESKTAECITAEVPILKGDFTYTYTWILDGEVVKTETTTSNTSSLNVARDLIEDKTCICKVSTTLGDRSYDAENQIEIPAVVPEEDDDSDESVNQNIMFIGSITAVVIALFALAFVISKRK